MWDFSAVTTNGHPCLDQVGRGVGQLITGFGAGKKNSITGTQSWPNEALEPVYSWLENWTIPSGGGGNSFYAPFDPSTGAIVNNQDIYFQAGAFNGACATFTGTCGTGSGLLSARPATCTAGPGGNTNGVAYWGTDTNTLYVCNPTNTWTAYYTPYTYPHPLTQGLTSGSGTPPVAPTNLTAAVQ